MRAVDRLAKPTNTVAKTAESAERAERAERAESGESDWGKDRGRTDASPRTRTTG